MGGNCHSGTAFPAKALLLQSRLPRVQRRGTPLPGRGRTGRTAVFAAGRIPVDEGYGGSLHGERAYRLGEWMMGKRAIGNRSPRRTERRAKRKGEPRGGDAPGATVFAGPALRRTIASLGAASRQRAPSPSGFMNGTVTVTAHRRGAPRDVRPKSPENSLRNVHASPRSCRPPGQVPFWNPGETGLPRLPPSAPP